MSRTKVRPLEAIGYSFIPNHRATMLALARASLTSQEGRVIIALLNQTDGYLRPEDKISIRFWQAITLMSGESIHHTLKRLLARGLITSETREDGTFYHVPPPNEWPTEVFHPQQVSRKALGEATKLLAREKDQANYLWLRRLLQEAQAVLPENLSNQTGSGGPTRKPVQPDREPVQPDRSPVQPDRLLDTKKPLESTKESTKESMEGKTPSINSRGVTLKRTEGDPRVQETALALEKERGYKSPNYGGEARAIKWMLGQGHSPDDILACWRALKRDPWWASRELLLMSVQKEIGQWVKAGRRPDAFEKKGGYGKAGGYAEKRGTQQYTSDDQA